MRITYLRLKNWKNFRKVELHLDQRLIITGPNAAGKSNLLDAFRFLRDISKSGGGLQDAVRSRNGIPKIRCLKARQDPVVELEIKLEDGDGETKTVWAYEIGIRQTPGKNGRVQLAFERVSKNSTSLLNRPDKHDDADPLRLTQTHLEQINANKKFREVADWLDRITYLHLVPQLLKYPSLSNRDTTMGDPFGSKFLERVSSTPEKTRNSRLKKIEDALKLAVPELNNLQHIKDENGVPHLEAIYKHWRPGSGKQREDQFSDGTLRLIGLLWTLLESDGLLLLEEPELSLHSAIVRKLPAVIWKLQQGKGRQVFLTSHSADLLSDKGIRPEEVALLTPGGEKGTHVQTVDTIKAIAALYSGGMSMADAVIPRTEPNGLDQLPLSLSR